MNDVIRDLAIDHRSSRCALITFGSEAYYEFGFLSLESSSAIAEETFKTTQREGGGGTAAALQEMLTLLEKHGKPENPAIAVVFVHENAADKQALIERAQVAHQKGISICVVKTGSGADDMEVSSIASDSRFVLRVENIERLYTYRVHLEHTLVTIETKEWWKNKIQVPAIPYIPIRPGKSSSFQTEKPTTSPKAVVTQQSNSSTTPNVPVNSRSTPMSKVNGSATPKVPVNGPSTLRDVVTRSSTTKVTRGNKNRKSIN